MLLLPLVMKAEFFIARRLKLSGNSESNAPSLNVAMIGIILAIVIMILSVVIVTGFKSEVMHKIYSLDSHLKVSNAGLGIDDNYSTVDAHDVFNAVLGDPTLKPRIESMSLIAEKPAILKTDDDFKGIVYRGVDQYYDWRYLKENLVAGRVPNCKDGADNREIIISKYMAQQLQLHVGDKIFTYFIDNKVKMRRSIIVGIYNTDFDAFDQTYIVGNISLLQSVNNWSSFTGNYVGINLNQLGSLDNDCYRVYSDLCKSMVAHNSPTLYQVTQIKNNNVSYFTWLGMLDMNVAIILILMIIVSSFTLIAALLMIVLERIKMVGMLKAMGATNRSISRIFIYLTSKLIVKSVIIGNVVGIGLALLQQHFHIVRLNADAYYMSYVPISIDIPTLLLLNVGIIVISYLTLLAPSHIVSTIKPTSTMQFE